jgi:Uncharacterized protein conserved in bacteria (DUF2252)
MPARATASRSRAYLGDSARFDEAIAEFASSYADQNQRDYDAFVAAVASGRLEAAATP